jgi:hypothetical protein
VKITVNKIKPAIYEYFYKPSRGKLYGDIYGSEPRPVICKGADLIWSGLVRTLYDTKFAEDMINYHTFVTCGKDDAVEFDLVFKLVDNGVSLRFDNVIEKKDFHLLAIRMPNLITVKNEANNAKLVIPSDSGRLVNVATASCKDVNFKLDWVNPLLTEIVYNDKVIGILESTSLENQMVSSIYEYEDVYYGSISLNFIHRLMDYEAFGYRILANDPRYHLLVQDSSEALISLIGDYDGDGEISWIDAAKYIRDRINVSINPLYAGKLIYKIYLDDPSLKEPTTFSDALELIMKIAHLTDFAPQIVYLVGWQYNGHDTGYPAIDEVNEKIGGREGLIKLIREAEKFNALVSFHDNYDDAYMHSPEWDAEIISRDPEGHLMKGGVWAGGQSYTISNYKYAKKRGLQRVHDTLTKYPIKVSYHIDVLSAIPRRYDFNPESPAGAKRNLDGKISIIKEFNKHGVDVTSEGFCEPFVGYISHFWHLIRRDEVYYLGEEQIPLIPFIYHSKASYGGIISSKLDIIKALLYGATFSFDFDKNSNLQYITDLYYLVTLPWSKFYGKNMQSYHKKGTIERISYEDESYVEADLKKREYVVVVNGEIISKNFTCFVPMKKDLYLGYSKEGGLFKYPIPTQHKEKKCAHVLKLSASGETKEVNFQLDKNFLEYFAEPKTPYRIIFK